MIIAEFIKSEEKFLGFKISGHAGYAQAGEDICCAAVSSAVMMTCNMVTEIFAVDAEVSAEENKIMLFLSQKEDENGDIIQKSVETHNFKGEVINSKLITKKEIITDKEHIFRHCINQKTNALWNKIISRELIGNLQFDESLRIGEDLIFFLSLIQKTSRYILSPTGIYHYIIHQESIMQTAKKDPVACIRSTLNLVPKIKDSTIAHPRIYKGIIAETIFIQLYRKRKFFSSEERKRIKNIIDEIRWKDLIYIPVRKKIKFLWKKIMWYRGFSCFYKNFLILTFKK